MINVKFRFCRSFANRRFDLGVKCDVMETRRHFFMECPPVHDLFCVLNEILQNFVKQRVSVDEIFTVSFWCKEPTRNVIGVWFVIKVFFCVLQDENEGAEPILNKIVNCIDWIIKYCGGKFSEIFYELRTEIEIQKLGYLLDF